MREKTRRILEMGQRALDFARAHPDSTPEYRQTVARLEALLARAEELKLQEKKENEQRPSRNVRGSGPTGKVLPFERPSSSDPTDPAA